MRNQNRPTNYAKVSYGQKLSIANAGRRRGDVSDVARKTGFAISTVSYVLSGRFKNERIVNAAYNISRGRKAAVKA
jgi:hypothetical protein